MTSFEVIQNCGSGDSIESSDYSFLPEVQNVNNSEQVVNTYNLTNMQSALVSESCGDLSLEVVNCIQELMEKNMSLKEALKRNNQMMKEKFEPLIQWRENTLQFMDQQQADLNSCKEKIGIFEKENAELMDKLKVLEDSNKNAEELKIQLCDAELQVDNLKKALKEKEELDKITADLQAELGEAREELGKAKEELKRMSNTLEEKENEVVEALKLELAKAKEKFEDALKKLEEKDKLVEELTNISEERTGSSSKDMFELDDYDEFVKIEASDLEVNLLSKYKNRCKLLQFELSQCQEKLDLLQLAQNEVEFQHRESTGQLLELLKLEQQSSEENKSKFQEKSLNCDQMTEAFSRCQDEAYREFKMRQELELQKEKETKEYLEKIDFLTAQLLDTEQKLEDREERVKALSEEKGKIMQDSADVQELKAQIEVLKTDLQNSITEIEKKNRIIENFNRSSGNITEPVTIPECPICTNSFATFDDLQRHASTCVDQSSVYV